MNDSECSLVSCYQVVHCVSVFVWCRDGSVRARCLSWMNTAQGTEFGVVIDTCVTCVISWKGQKMGPLSTPHFFTTASLFVPLMSMGTGVR